MKSKMSEKEVTASPVSTKAHGFSLAMKLNGHLTADLLLLFITLDIMFTIAMGVYVFQTIERSGSAVVDAIAAGQEPKQITLPLGYTLSEAPPSRDGVYAPFAWKTELENGQLTKGNARFLFNTSAYISCFTCHDISYRLTYDLTWELETWRSILLVLLIAECVLYGICLVSGSLTVRRAMRPIGEMERVTRALRETTPKELSRLAERVSTIDATDLDTRLSVLSTQEELRGLADAINGLLERVDESYRMQVRFVSDASHELRTPIAVIRGYANLLDRWGKEDENTLQESITAIKNEADNMKDLVEQLLFLARGDNETMAVEMTLFDLSVLADEIFTETQLIDVSHELTFDSCGSVMIEADQALMKQAIRILIDNSIKYTPAGEKITLKLQKNAEQACLTVQDNGIGIVVEDIPYIFDRFYRSDESRARQTGGTGLGLSIAKWIIHRHSGHLEVVSRKDFGTRISAVLPLRQQKEL